MGRSLDITIVTPGGGAMNGKVWWLDEDSLRFVLRRPLPHGRRHLARLELGDYTEPVEISLKVRSVHHGPDTPFKRSHFHVAAYSPVDVDRADDLVRCILRHNPNSPPGALSLVSSVRADRTRSSQGRTSSSMLTPGSTRTPVTSTAGGHGRHSGRARLSRAATRATSRRGETKREPETQGRPSRDRRRREPPPPEPTSDGSSGESSSSAGRKALGGGELIPPRWSPGPPPTLLVHFYTRGVMKRSLRLGATWARIVVAEIPELEIGDSFELVLKLPDRSFVQMPGRLLRRGPHRMVLEARDLPASTIAALAASQR